MSTSNSISVTADSYLTLHYRLAVDGAPADEALVSTFGQNPATLQMGSGQLAAPLEAQLLGLKVGEHRTFVLQPEQAFGPRNPELIQKVSRTLLAAESSADAHYQPGDVVEFRKSPQGLPDQRVAAVLQELNDQYALFDFNHPLAGQTVSFEVKIVGVL